MAHHRIARDGISRLLSNRGTGALSVTRRSSRRSVYGVGLWWDIVHHTIATDRTSGLLLDRGLSGCGQQPCRVIWRSRWETGGYRAERICHRIARTRLRELLLKRGHRMQSAAIRRFGGHDVAIGWDLIHHRIARTGFGDSY